MGAGICHMCKDPIWSFICTDCLSNDIKNWLPPSLSKEFESFSHLFKKYFFGPLAADTRFESCIKCNQRGPAPVCSYCYLSEVCQWLEPRNCGMAKKLIRMIPRFPECKITNGGEFVCKDENSTDVAEAELFNKRTQFGICDKCGEYSEELCYDNACWVCEACR